MLSNIPLSKVLFPLSNTTISGLWYSENDNFFGNLHGYIFPCCGKKLALFRWNIIEMFFLCFIYMWQPRLIEIYLSIRTTVRSDFLPPYCFILIRYRVASKRALIISLVVVTSSHWLYPHYWTNTRPQINVIGWSVTFAVTFYLARQGKSGAGQGVMKSWSVIWLRVWRMRGQVDAIGQKADIHMVFETRLFISLLY